MSDSTFPYTLADVLQILGIENKNRIVCPFCGTNQKLKEMGIDNKLGRFHCFRCDLSGQGTKFYAYYHSIDTKQAHKEILEQLGIERDEPVPTTRKIEKFVPKPILQSPMSDLKTRDNTYRHLLSLLSLSEKHKKSLLDRGFTEDEISLLDYKSYPEKEKSNDITSELLKSGCKVEGVPGFFMYHGKWTLSYRKSGIMVPYISNNNKIEGIQIRKDEELLEIYGDGRKENKYSWLSSFNLCNGCASKGFVHYSCDYILDKEKQQFSPLIRNKTIAFTEGAMKADLFHACTNVPCISVPGVNILEFFEKELVFLKNQGVDTILNMYDMDYLINPHVQNAIEKVEQMIKNAGISYKRVTWNTIVPETKEDVLKGIDDYYAYKTRGIIPVIKTVNQ